MRTSDPKTVNPFHENDDSAPKDMPPLTVMSLSARSIVNHQENKREIVGTSARVWQDSEFRKLYQSKMYADACCDSEH